MNRDDRFGSGGLAAPLVEVHMAEDLLELEERLERQLLDVLGGDFGEGCLWYLCSPKCEGSKCIVVCTMDL